jgi:NADH-quinone oxidoreductase subunit N
MLVFLLSLAGIPATAGFIGKWWLFASVLQGSGYRWLAVLAALNTAISLYYYLRVVVRMYMEVPAEELPYAVTPSLTVAVVLAAVGTLAIGLWPEPVLRLVSGTAQLLP